MRTTLLGAIVALTAFASLANAQQVRITVENTQPDDGFYLTPVWMGFHNGSYDLFDAGVAATQGLEELAEDGLTGTLTDEFNASGAGGFSTVVTSPGGFAGAPVFDPGESVSTVFNLSSSDRFLTFASMVIPTNDSFIGNGNALELFDAAGNFVGPSTIDIAFANVWDAGTEENDGFGAPFTPNGGTSTDENGTVSLPSDLTPFDGLATADGTNINLASASASNIARITITAVPEPSTLGLLGLFGLGLISRRRR